MNCLHVEKAFNEVDTDGSGYIDAGEVKALLDKVAEAEGFEAPSEEAIQARKYRTYLESIMFSWSSSERYKKLLTLYIFVCSIIGLEELPTDEPGKLKLEGIIFVMAMMKVLAIAMFLFDSADSDQSGKLEVRLY